MKRKIALVLVCLLLLAAFTACSGTPAEETQGSESPSTSESTPANEGEQGGDDQITIGLTARDLAIPAYTSITNILQGLCDENGIQLTAVSANADPAKQASQIENFVQSGVDTIIIMEAVEQSAAADPTKAAVEAGVPVIGYGLAVEGNTTDLVCPNYDIGYAEGEQCAEYMKENFGGKGKVALLHLSLTSEGGIDRYNGAKDALAELVPDVEIVAEQFAQTTEEGVEVTENLLQANPDLNAIISSSGGGAVGAAEAIISHGKNDGSVVVFSTDTTTDVLSALKDDNNPIIATVCVGSDSFMANKLFEMSMLIINGEPYEEHYLSELEKLDATNVDEFIERENIEL